MPLYDDYKPYHKELSQGEKVIVAVAQQRRGNTPPTHTFTIQNGRVVMDDPVLNAYANIAYTHADRYLWNVNMPATANLDRKYPGVDPEGKHCHVDMDFAQRLSCLESAAENATGNNKKILTEFIESYRTKQGVLGKLASKVDKDCQNIQASQTAAMLCHEKTTSHILESEANRIAETSPNIQKMKDIFTAMEQVAGLHRGPIAQQTIAMYNLMEPKEHLYPTVPTGFYVKTAVPDKLNIDFPNLDNVILQNYHANPKHWGLSPDQRPPEPSDSAALDACLSRYASGTVTNALDGLFSPVELSLENSSKISPYSGHRATLIIVDGKTVSEHMQEYYNSLKGDKEPFNKWYADNLKDMSGRIVAAGLMSGKRVEAFVPGPDGKLPDQPKVLHRTGYEPGPLKPVTLNAWERFFNKFGFYKEKAAQAREQQKHLDARERLKANYANAQDVRLSSSGYLMKDMFFGDFLRKNNIGSMQQIINNYMSVKAPYPHKINRSSATGACICMMAADGYNIRDIMDPSKLIQEKQAAGEKYFTMRMTNPALYQLTDRNAKLTDPERIQLTNKLMADIADHHPFTEANAIMANLPAMPQRLLPMGDQQRQNYLKNALDQGPLNDNQAQELKQLQALQANAGQTPLSDPQAQRLAELTRQQQQWQDYQDYQQWNRAYQQGAKAAGQKRDEVLVRIGQEQRTVQSLLTEAQNDPNFKLNPFDPRIPRYLREGNNEWLGAVFFRGQQALTQQINEIMSNTDLNDPAQRMAVMPLLRGAAVVCLDGAQDIQDKRIMLGYTGAALSQVKDKAPNISETVAVEAANDLSKKTLSLSLGVDSFFSILSKADAARSAMIQPISDGKSVEHLSALVTENEMLKLVNPDKKLPSIRRIPDFNITSLLQDKLGNHPVIKNYCEEMDRSQRPAPKAVLSGELAKSFTVKMNHLEPDVRERSTQKLVLDRRNNPTVVRVREISAIPQLSVTVKAGPQLGNKGVTPAQSTRSNFRF